MNGVLNLSSSPHIRDKWTTPFIMRMVALSLMPATIVGILVHGWQAFGIVALEAMARGIPLIASNVGGLPDFVKDGENGLLFDPSNPANLVGAFDRLAALSQESIVGMVSAARATADQFTWRSVIDRLMRLYPVK